MSKLIFLLICYNLLHLNLAAEAVAYDPPQSIQFPFGDEELNSDIKEGRFFEEMTPILVETITDFYTFCPNTTEEQEPSEHGGVGAPHSEKKCLRCDIRPTVDKTGALVECFNCTDVSRLTEGAEEDDQSEHVLYLANYLELTNYTAPI